MAKQKKNNNVKETEVAWRIVGISTTRLAFIDIDVDFLELDKLKNLGVDLKLKVKVDEGEKDNAILSVDVITTLLDQDDEKIKYVEHTGSTKYNVVGLKKSKNKEGKISFDIPDDFTVLVYGLSFSHARGLLASSLKGTKFQDYYLPIIDPSKLVSSNKRKRE